jgi:hypothetical protein
MNQQVSVVGQSRIHDREPSQEARSAWYHQRARLARDTKIAQVS